MTDIIRVPGGGRELREGTGKAAERFWKLVEMQQAEQDEGTAFLEEHSRGWCSLTQ